MFSRRSLLFTGALAAAGYSVDRARAAATEPIEHPGFPYHPVVFHLDLAVLAYQLYGQSLVWPFDPYYEELSGSGAARSELMSRVRLWAEDKGRKQLADPGGLFDLRGPGALGGFESNPNHDPILYRYGAVNPWSNCLNYPGERWIAYKTPKDITGHIKDVFVVYRRVGGAPGDAVVERLSPADAATTGNAGSDALLCFEGGTGDKGEAGQPHSQSLMGFVLLRNKPGCSMTDRAGYDVHIAFRGSRSGSASRALKQALSDKNARGNPDWITDMGFDRLAPGQGGEIISSKGGVSRGFTHSMISILPALTACLQKISELANGSAPDNIYVTGHSLGGALAQHFASAMLQGNAYGPDGTGPAMPQSLQKWPWTRLKLVTFSAPRAGDEEWAKRLTEDNLRSEFFSSMIAPTDDDALDIKAAEIVPRLLSINEPAGFRVLISSDPITTEKVGGGGKHVGKTVYVDKAPGVIGTLFKGIDFEAHEITNVRKYATASLSDSRIPPTSWDYLSMQEINPDRDEKKKGTPQEYAKLGAALKNYYAVNGIDFHATRFDRDLDAFLELLAGGQAVEP